MTAPGAEATLPAGLRDIVGHHVTLDLLHRAIAAERLSHAYLITGPAGVGRRTLALAIAKALNCEAAPDERPCNACRPCRLIDRGADGDVRIITRDPDRKGILLHPRQETSQPDTDHSVKFIQEDAARRPVFGRKKVYVILGAEDLIQEAANRLLKTLEEPTPYVHFLLTAGDRQAVLPTIASRCQELRLQLAPRDEIAAALVRRGLADPARAAELARLAEGRPGWALAAAGDPATQEVFRANVRELQLAMTSTSLNRLVLARAHAEQWSKDKERVRTLLRAWLTWLRTLVRVQLGLETEGDLETARFAAALEPMDVQQCLERVSQALTDLESNVNHRLVLDTLLLSLPDLSR